MPRFPSFSFLPSFHGLRAALLLAFCFGAFVPLRGMAEGAAAAGVERGVTLRRLGEGTVEIAGDTQVEGDPSQIMSPVLKGTPIFSRLLGVSVAIRLREPVVLRWLAIPRVGWDDWAVPGEVAISIDGKSYGSFPLSAPVFHPSGKQPQAVDVIDLGGEVSASEIEVEVLAAAPLKGGNKHGTLRVLAAQRETPKP